MSKRVLQTAAAFSLLLGIVLVLGSGTPLLIQANLTGQGSTILMQPQEAPILLTPAHGAALPQVAPLAQAHAQLLIGMLLILLGFLFHVLLRLRGADRNSVRIRSVPHTPVHTTRLRRRGPTYYWMEIRI